MTAGGQVTLGQSWGNDGRTRARPGTPMSNPVSLEDLVISERFVRASGPGGQNVNKVATAVQLRVDLRASPLPEAIRNRLIALGGRQVTSDAVLVIVSRVHRTQAMNRHAARTRLAALLMRAAAPPAVRRPTRPRAAEREKRLVAKKRRSTVKRGRGRPDDE